MGDRRHVILRYSNGRDIYLYTHWGGSELPKTVQNVLKRKERWDDETYLARMIFSEMIKDEIDSPTGYGLAPFEMETEYDDILVYLEDNTVQIGTQVSSFEQFIKLTFV